MKKSTEKKMTMAGRMNNGGGEPAPESFKGGSFKATYKQISNRGLEGTKGMKYKENGAAPQKTGGMKPKMNGTGSSANGGQKPKQADVKGNFSSRGIYNQNGQGL